MAPEIQKHVSCLSTFRPPERGTESDQEIAAGQKRDQQAGLGFEFGVSVNSKLQWADRYIRNGGIWVSYSAYRSAKKSRNKKNPMWLCFMDVHVAVWRVVLEARKFC